MPAPGAGPICSPSTVRCIEEAAHMSTTDLTQHGHTGPASETPAQPSSPPTHPRGKLARRVLLTAGGLALCGGAAALTPAAINTAEHYTEDQIHAAFAAGASNARAALLKDLAELEGISIDAALGAATLTQLAVTAIVLPAARVATALGTGALDILINALAFAINGLGYIPGGAQVALPLRYLHDMLSTWRLNLATFPQDLSAASTWDITSAETYLKALQAKIQAEQNATPVPTPTAGY
jgi:uncharacterized membrane protein YqaE (UPF0057 family)